MARRLVLAFILVSLGVTGVRADEDLAAQMRNLDPKVIPPDFKPGEMLWRDARRRLQQANAASSAGWGEIKNRGDWEKFRKSLHQPLTLQSPVATAMRFAPSAAAQTRDAQVNATHTDSPSEKLGKHAPPAARPPDAARLATVARDINRDKHRKTATPAENARRLAQEERARRWAYQQDANGSTFAGRFLGYAD